MADNNTRSSRNPTWITSRRNVMRSFSAVGAGMTIGLAGCIGDDDADPGDPTPTPDDPQPEVISVAPATGPTTLDPHDHRETTTQTIVIHFYDGLIERDADMEIVPRLAEDWELVDDTTWQFDLREGIEFSNGEPFDAEVAKYNLDRISGNLSGADSVLIGDRYESYESVEILDDYRIQVNLSRPDPLFLEYQAMVLMVPKQYTEENGFGALSDDPIGTGPFELDDWVRDQELRMVARDDYWRDGPFISEAVWQPMPESSSRIASLLTEDVDIIRSAEPRDEEQIEAAGVASLERVPSARGAMLWINQLEQLPEEYGGHEPATRLNPEVRKAINLAIDVDAIIDEILLGNGNRIHGWAYNEDFLGFNDEIEPWGYDPDRARDLLAEGGYPDGFEATLLVPRGRYFKGEASAEAVATMLGNVGIDVTLDVPEFGVFAEQTQEGIMPELMFAAWGLSSFNAIDAYTTLALPGAMFSLLPVEDQPPWAQEVGELILEAQATTDPEPLGDLIFQIEQLLHDNAAFAPLFQYIDVYGVNTRVDWQARSDEHIDLSGASIVD